MIGKPWSERWDPISSGRHRPEELWSRLQTYRGALGAALLDQSVVAGVGNVLRAESLFAAGLNPGRPASTLQREEFDRLRRTLVVMMRRAVDENRIITVSDATDRTNLPEQQARMVYKQPVCRRCGTPVATSVIGGHNAYVCPVCQLG